MGKLRFINPDTIGQPPGYTHVVEATAPSRLVYIAGQLGIDRNGAMSSDFRGQVVQTFKNLAHALAAVGARFEHVVKLNNYLTDMSHLPIFREVRDSYLPERDRPASTTVAISALARAGALIEIEAVAVLPAASPSRPARRTGAGRSAGTRGAAKGATKTSRKVAPGRRK